MHDNNKCPLTNDNAVDSEPFTALLMYITLDNDLIFKVVIKVSDLSIQLLLRYWTVQMNGMSTWTAAFTTWLSSSI